MLFTDCRVGMEIIFGRGNGEQTRGIIEKMNRVKAKVRTIENRGQTNAGAVWSVPYSMMVPIVGIDHTQPVTSPSFSPDIKFNVFQDPIEIMILETINTVYNHLSPECLSCDGELPLSTINAKRAKLNKQLRGLFQAYGREVSEDVAFRWMQEKRNFEANKALPLFPSKDQFTT